MKEQISKMLADFKSQKIAASTIENELGFSNGLLGKAAKGDTSLSDEKFQKLTNYYDVKFPKQEIKKAPTEIPFLKKMSVASNGELTLKSSPESEKRLKETIAKLNKDYGDGAVMYMSQKPKNIEVISTGSIGLDHALGVGGLPKGRITEIYGPESSGKTTIAIHVIAEAQKLGGKCAFIDAEHAFDETYAKSIGVDIGNLLLSQPDYGEQALEVADRLIVSGGISVIVIDSVAALVPKSELEGEMGDSKMGLHARLMSQACRKLTALISKTGTICIFINQLREKIGVTWGNPEVTTGGNALKFYASVRLDVRKSTQIKDGDTAMGNLTKVKVVKNKVAPPFKTTEFDIIYGEGISRNGEVVDMGTLLGIINKSGSWYSYNNDKLGQGRDAVMQLLRDNPEMQSQIEQKIKEKMRTSPTK